MTVTAAGVGSLPARPRVLPTLIACSHGTDSIAGRTAVRAILDDVRAWAATLFPGGLQVRQTFVDVQHPRVDEVVSQVVRDGAAGRVAAIVVPLLLSGGFHVNVDIDHAAAASAGRAVAAGPLGPDRRLVRLLLRRLLEAGVHPRQPVVLAAAGSSDPRAGADVSAVAGQLRRLRPGSVRVGFGSSAVPTVSEAVAAAGPNAAVASYLLAPGFFHDRLDSAGACVVTAPLAPDPVLAEIVLDRYLAAWGCTRPDPG